MNNLSTSKFFKNIQNYHKDINDVYEQPLNILPSLRSYQRRAVNWLIDREKNNDLCTSDGSPFSGGILADEMGLGKTVEMLCCIMSNVPPLEFYNQEIKFDISQKKSRRVSTPRPSTSKYIPYSSKELKIKSKKPYQMLSSWYESILSEMSTVSKKKNEISPDEDAHIVECYCVKTPPTNTLVFCAICDKGQHAQCVNFQPKPFQEVPYLCAKCWTVNDKFHCKATLIVVPQSILDQWLVEIEKHVANPSLNIFVYNGVHSDGYIQPITFNEYDIVITSYTNLSRDLNYTGNSDLENDTVSRLRYSKKYYYPQSPLPCIKWWRICLDEGQAIESANTKVSEMTSCLKSVHRWAMTGTPIQKSLNDLYGILKFLDVSPYCNRKRFLEFMNGDVDFVYSWFSKLIWRNSIEDVNSELNIPKVTYEQHWLTFSHIEKHFYLTQHDVCSTTFLSFATRLFPLLEVRLKNLDKKTIYSLIGPLYKLRQACVHPQAINGQFLKIKGTMTMEKLMDIMIEKCSIECNDILRSYVSQHNALAGLYLIRSQSQDAVNHYRIVLGLMEKYKDKKLKIDTCQKIHVMYNLVSVLDDNSTTIPHTENCIELKKNMESLEKEYLDASKQNIAITRKTVTFYLEKVAKLIENRTLSYSDWWSDMLDWIFPPKDFLTKVKADLEDYRVPGVPNIANRLKTMNDVYSILNVWLSDLNRARDDSISLLTTLEETPMNDLVQCALLCHLRIKSTKIRSKKERCLLCKSEFQLEIYESLLFSVSNKKKTLSTEETDEETTYESTSRGFWKMSQKEFLLTKLFQYGQAKIINKNCLKDASEHIKVLELVRKEFRYLRLLWTHLSDSLSAHDEIVMAKSRLKLGENYNPEADGLGPPKKRPKKENECDVILEEYVGQNMVQLKSEIIVNEALLEKKIGTLLYLENLKKEKENSTENEPCPICCLTNDTEWAVLQCGHSLCNICTDTLCNNTLSFQISCPMCRNNTDINSISYVKSNQEENPVGLTIKGSFSTKIENITLKLLELIGQDPKVKVLIFSTWEKALHLLGEALEQNLINFRILKTGNKYKKTLRDFKKNEKINALLMKLSLGSKGLNLTEATRIFFMEPIINKTDELQAIGRINRIGQTKPTFVHNFIIRNSIEENITNIFSGNQLDRWDDVTLHQMVSVFRKQEE